MRSCNGATPPKTSNPLPPEGGLILAATHPPLSLSFAHSLSLFLLPLFSNLNCIWARNYLNNFMKLLSPHASTALGSQSELHEAKSCTAATGHHPTAPLCSTRVAQWLWLPPFQWAQLATWSGMSSCCCCSWHGKKMCFRNIHC